MIFYQKVLSFFDFKTVLDRLKTLIATYHNHSMLKSLLKFCFYSLRFTEGTETKQNTYVTSTTALWASVAVYSPFPFIEGQCLSNREIIG